MNKELIDLIDRARWKAGSYKAVAEKMGINSTRLSEYKNGTRNPSAFVICQLADIAELNVSETLFQIMEKLDTDNAELWKIWRPYGDSNPGYRRERGQYPVIQYFVKFCNLVSKMAKLSNNHANFQVLNVRNVALF